MDDLFVDILIWALVIPFAIGYVITIVRKKK